MVTCFEEIRPFDRTLIRKGYEAIGYIRARDGSAIDFSMVGYLLTKKIEGDIRSDLLTAKCKVSKCTIVVNKFPSLVLSLCHTFATLCLLPRDPTRNI